MIGSDEVQPYAAGGARTDRGPRPKGALFWKRSFLVFVVVLGVAVPFVFTRPRVYKSETVILYQETIHSSDLTGTGGGEGSEAQTRRVGARLREVLMSRANLEPIVKDLNLYNALNDRRGGLVDAVEDMRKHITFRAREGDTFEISFTGDTPEQTQEVTRRLADAIVQEAVARRAENAKALKDFLDAESERNKTEVKTKEGDLAKFLALHPEFAPPPGTPGAVAVPRPTGVPAMGSHAPRPGDDPTIIALEARAARIERQLKPAGTTNGGGGSGSNAANDAPQADSPELVAARRDLADKLSRFTDKHPDVIAAKNRVKAAEAAQAAARAAAAPTSSPQPSAPAEEQQALTADERESLKRQLAQLVNEIAIRRQVLRSGGAAAAGVGGAPVVPDSPVTLEVEYRRLLHEVDDARDRQRQLDARQFKASITANSVMSDRNIQVSILDPPYLPSHAISQPRSTMLMIGGLIAVFLALLVAVLSARLDDRIHDRIDLEVLDILPIVGVIPRLSAGERKNE